MKWIISLLLALTLIPATAMAQTDPSAFGNTLSRQGKNLYLDGRPLVGDEIRSVLGDNLSKVYRKGKTQKLLGTIFLPTGCVALLGGVTIFVDYYSISSKTGMIFARIFTVPLGVLACGFGGGLAITGIVMLCAGNNNLNNVVIGYNTSNKYALTLSPSSSGIGLALNF